MDSPGLRLTANPQQALARIEEALNRHNEYWRSLSSSAELFFACQDRFLVELSSAGGEGERPGSVRTSNAAVIPAAASMNALNAANMASVKRMMKLRQAPLMLLGANSAGKSTFVNALLQGSLMPTGGGHVTARICRLSYEPQETAFICTSRLNVAEGRLEEEPNSRRSIKDVTSIDKLYALFALLMLMLLLLLFVVRIIIIIIICYCCYRYYCFCCCCCCYSVSCIAVHRIFSLLSREIRRHRRTRPSIPRG